MKSNKEFNKKCKSLLNKWSKATDAITPKELYNMTAEAMELLEKSIQGHYTVYIADNDWPERFLFVRQFDTLKEARKYVFDGLMEFAESAWDVHEDDEYTDAVRRRERKKAKAKFLTSGVINSTIQDIYGQVEFDISNNTPDGDDEITAVAVHYDCSDKFYIIA